MKKIILWIGASAVLGAAIPALAIAQETAQSSASGGSELTEILVTAQRRSERSQDVPMAVTALSADQLEASNITTIFDVQQVVPALRVEAVNGTITTFIRGIGSNLTQAGNEASVPVYVDGIYYSRLNPILLRLLDVDRVEVLEGPQGTLFGRNSVGGLVNVITNSPTPGQPLSAAASLGYASYQTVDGAFSISDSLTDKLAGSISAVYHDQAQGWGRNLFTEAEAYLSQEFAIRGKLTFDLTESTTFGLTAEDSRADSDIGDTKRINPPSGYPDGSGYVPYLPFYDVMSNFEEYYINRDWGGSAFVRQRLPFGTLIDTVAYHHLETDAYFDADVTYMDTADVSQFYSGRDITNDLQLVSLPESRTKWNVGVFYMDSNASYWPWIVAGPVLGPVPGIMLQNFAKQNVKSIAPYGQATQEIFQDTNLTLGLRYTVDRDNAYGYSGIATPVTGFVQTPGSYANGHKDFSKLTWNVTLDHKFTPDVMAYVSAKRGFKAGNFNLLPFQTEPVQPEVLDAYELGVKNEFFDHTLRLNAAVFYNIDKDLQVSTTPQTSEVLLLNAPRAISRGVTLSAEDKASRDLDLNIGVQLLDAKFTDFPNAPFYYPNPNPPYGILPAMSESADGNRLPQAPHTTANVGFNYHVHVTEHDLIALGANFRYTSRFYWDADNIVAQGGYGVLDANLTYTFSNSGLKIQLWSNNLTNKKYYVSEVESAGAVGNIFAPAAPRFYGVTFNYDFKGSR